MMADSDGNETRPGASAGDAPSAAALSDSAPSAESPMPGPAERSAEASPELTSVDVLSAVQTLLAQGEALIGNDAPVTERQVKTMRRRWQTLRAQASIDDAVVTQLESTLGELRRRVERDTRRRERERESLMESLSRLEEALAAGNSTAAQSLYQRLEARLEKPCGLPAGQQRAMRSRLLSAAPRLHDLTAWRRWSTDLARNQLIEEIAALIDASEPPIEIARKVREARETWRRWDRAGDPAARSLWRRFDDVCTKAYAPCQRHFDALAQQRERNREQREGICLRLEQLAAESDWDHPDWRALDRAVTQAATDWRRPLALDRKHRKPLEQRFDKARSLLESHLGPERERCLAARRALVENIAALAGADDLDQAIAQTKQAQRQWRPTVLAPPAEERRLWREFRAACDAVFARRRSELEQRDAERREHLSAKEQLCAELEALAEKTPVGAAGRERLAAAKTRWRAIGATPADSTKPLERRFRDACRQMQDCISAADREHTRQQLALLRTKALLCARVEAAPDEAVSQAAEELVAGAQAEWASLPTLAEAEETAFGERFRRACDAALDVGAARAALAAELEANLAVKQDLCLRLEVAAEVESPPEFAKARLQLQVARLSAAMSGGVAGGVEGPKDAEELARRYWRVGAAPALAVRALDERFERAYAAISSRADQS